MPVRTTRPRIPARPDGAPPRGDDRSMMTGLKRLNALLTRRNKRDMLILFVLMLVGAGLETLGVGAIPAFVGMVAYPETIADYPMVRDALEWLGGSDPRGLLIAAILALIVLFAVKNAVLILEYYLQERFINNRRITFARMLVQAYLQAPYTFHLSRNTSELIRNINTEANTLATHVLGPILEMATRGLVLLAITGLLLAVEPLITLGWFLVFGTVAGASIFVLNARMKRHGRDEQRHRQLLLQALAQGFGGIKESRVLNRESYFSEKILVSVRGMSQAIRSKQFANKLIKPVTEFLAIVGLFAVAIALILLGRPTESIVVTLALFVVGLARFREASSALVQQYANLRYSIVTVDPIYEDLSSLRAEARHRPRRQDEPARRLDLHERIELSGVWYRYPDSRHPALQDIDLTIPAGSAVGFVGGTGAGKSTLVDIILGLLEPERGRVLVDGCDIHAAGPAAWQRTIGYVPQSIYLLDDTLRRNIALGLADEEIDEDRVRRAVKGARLEGLVGQLGDGLNTFLGEQGVRLSGGERQRVGIARALYHDPAVLVFDEATSALDNATERAVIEAIEALHGERTVIMIAHRLSTVKTCNTLYVLQDGRIAGAGTYDELLETSGEFRKIAAQ